MKNKNVTSLHKAAASGAATKTEQNTLYQKVVTILEKARVGSRRAVNSAMVRAYWMIGQAIVEEEQRGKKRADYGERIIESLAEKLTKNYGRGFNARSLWRMRDFYLKFPILTAVRSELSWTHYRMLLQVEDSDARAFYESEAAAGN